MRRGPPGFPRAFSGLEALEGPRAGGLRAVDGGFQAGEGWRSRAAEGVRPNLSQMLGAARAQTSLLPPSWGSVGGTPQRLGRRRAAPDAGGPAGRPPCSSGGCDGLGWRGGGAPLTHPVLDLGRQPVRGPLVELRGAHGWRARRRGKGREGTGRDGRPAGLASEPAGGTRTRRPAPAADWRPAHMSL